MCEDKRGTTFYLQFFWNRFILPDKYVGINQIVPLLGEIMDMFLVLVYFLFYKKVIALRCEQVTEGNIFMIFILLLHY